MGEMSAILQREAAAELRIVCEKQLAACMLVTQRDPSVRLARTNLWMRNPRDKCRSEHQNRSPGIHIRRKEPAMMPMLRPLLIKCFRHGTATSNAREWN